MISLRLVCCGNENVRQFILKAQTELRSWVKNKNAYVYSMQKLNKAEFNPELLKKAH